MSSYSSSSSSSALIGFRIKARRERSMADSKKRKREEKEGKKTFVFDEDVPLTDYAWSRHAKIENTGELHKDEFKLLMKPEIRDLARRWGYFRPFTNYEAMAHEVDNVLYFPTGGVTTLFQSTTDLLMRTLAEGMFHDSNVDKLNVLYNDLLYDMVVPIAEILHPFVTQPENLLALRKILGLAAMKEKGKSKAINSSNPAKHSWAYLSLMVNAYTMIHLVADEKLFDNAILVRAGAPRDRVKSRHFEQVVEMRTTFYAYYYPKTEEEEEEEQEKARREKEGEEALRALGLDVY